VLLIITSAFGPAKTLPPKTAACAAWIAADTVVPFHVCTAMNQRPVKPAAAPAVPLLDHLEGKSQAPADLTAEYLNLAPSQHTEETLKATLGSCQNVC